MPRNFATAAFQDDTLLDDRFHGRSDHFAHFVAGDESRGIDRVCAKVTQRAGTRHITLKSPHQRSVGAGPILEVATADLINSSQLAACAQLMGQGDCRTAAIVVPNEGPPACLLSCLHHLTCIAQGSRQRFFAGDVLSRFEGCNRMFGMDVVGRDHIDQINRLVCHRGLPVGRTVLPSPAIGKFFQFFLIASGHGVHDRLTGKVKKFIDFKVSVRVSAPHEFGSNQGDVTAFALRRIGGHHKTPEY